MIELKVADYCHGCPDFDPVARVDTVSNTLYANGLPVELRTECKCQMAKRCDSIYRFIRKKIDVKPELINESMYWMSDNHYDHEEIKYIKKYDKFKYVLGDITMGEVYKRIGDEIKKTLCASEDGKVFYVRNDMLKIEYKIMVISE